VLIPILDILSFLVMGLLTIPAWISFFFAFLGGMFSGHMPQ